MIPGHHTKNSLGPCGISWGVGCVNIRRSFLDIALNRPDDRMHRCFGGVVGRCHCQCGAILPAPKTVQELSEAIDRNPLLRAMRDVQERHTKTTQIHGLAVESMTWDANSLRALCVAAGIKKRSRIGRVWHRLKRKFQRL